MSSKFIFMGLFFSCIATIFFFVLFRYQILQNDRYRSYVENVVRKQNTLRTLRGKIYDRNHDVPLATNISTFQILINPARFQENQGPLEVIDLARFLNTSEDLILKSLDKKNPTESVLLMDNLLYDEAVVLLEKLSNFEGLEWNRKVVRQYPFNDSMSHVIGYMGKIDDSEIRLLNFKGYNIYDEVGKTGVEKEYEEKLRGKTGLQDELVDVFGQSVQNSEIVTQVGSPGNDLVLTIDRNIQTIVEKALGQRVGSAIVLKPSTGEILAMVSYPRFNPNIFSLSADEKLITDIRYDRNSPFINRAIQSSTSPASTFKVLLQSAFYQEYKKNWNFSIFDKGYIEIGDRTFTDWYKKGRGWIGASDALAYSNNTFFFVLGVEKLGVTNIIKYASQFGLGRETQIDLPGEIEGVLPNPLWKSLRYKENWLDGDTANLSIGQGYISTTLIQLANLMAGVVNEGTIYVPHVLQSVREQVSGKIIKEYPPKVLHSIPSIDAEVYKQLKDDLRGVVRYGTAKVVLTTDVVNIAAKTGTGQIFTDLETPHFNSMFISYAPFDKVVDEQIVLAIWVDAVNEWEWWAPKAANIIYHAIFNSISYEEAIEDLKKKRTWYL